MESALAIGKRLNGEPGRSQVNSAELQAAAPLLRWCANLPGLLSNVVGNRQSSMAMLKMPLPRKAEWPDVCRFIALARKRGDADRDFFLDVEERLNGPKWFGIGLA